MQSPSVGLTHGYIQEHIQDRISVSDMQAWRLKLSESSGFNVRNRTDGIVDNRFIIDEIVLVDWKNGGPVETWVTLEGWGFYERIDQIECLG